MWAVWLVNGFAIAVAAATIAYLWPAFRTRPLGWQFLAASGIPLALGGVGFTIRFWEPTPGPYLANELYPFGAHLNAWAVSFGFMWLAFGLAIFAIAALAPVSRQTWAALFAAWCLAWLPHVVIGIAFVVAGSNAPSASFYQSWGSTGSGRLILGSSAVVLLSHVALSVAGFAITRLDLNRERRGPGSTGGRSA